MQKLLSLFFLLGVVMTGSSALGQSYPVVTGNYPHGTFQNLGPETINVGNLNVELTIPVLNKSGRGLPFDYNLVYNSSVWYPTNTGSGAIWEPVQDFGWQGNSDSELETGYISYNEVTDTGRIRGGGGIIYVCPTEYYNDFVYHDPFGIAHSFSGVTMNTSTQPAACNPPATQPTLTAQATDGSGYTLNVTDYDHATITSVTGVNIQVPYGSSGSGSVTDTNGNELTTDGQGHFTDTTGNVVLTIAGGAPNSEKFTYTDTQGSPEAITVNYTQYTVQTNFGCSGIGEYGPTPTSLVSSITLPDGTGYQFTYEQTPGYPGSVTGRIASVTLPTGGTITYTYTGSNDGINCSDGSTMGLTRSISGSTWTYSRSTPVTGSSTTTVEDGLGNYSIFDFIEGSNQPTDVRAEYYETDATIYNGPASGVPLLDLQTCYNYEAQQNAKPSPCSSSSLTLPITEISRYQLYSGTQEDGTSEFYNSYGLLDEYNQYDFGGASARGSLLRFQSWQYPGSGIVSDVQSTTVVDPSSGTALSETAYGYDQTTPVASSGVPEHVAVSGPRGNLTSVTQYASNSLTYTTTYTYEDTGSVLSVSSPSTSSGALTTFSYDPTFDYATGAQLPTPSSGVSMSASATYDESYTGLPISTTGVNGNVTTIKSYDEMLRPTQIDYPDGGSTTYSYTLNPTEIHIQRAMNGSTSADSQVTLDPYGRISVIAVQKDANDWYEVTYCYDADGRLSFKSYPALNQTGCSIPGDTYTYDALGGVTKITHADGSYQSFSYNGRATKWTNEAGSVTRITEVDGVGRPTAVCEVTSVALTGSGSPTNCGLGFGDTGYLTTYSYSGTTTTVTQGDQTRVFETDELGRPILTEEPESATTTYSYSLNSTGLVVTETRPEANQTNPSVTTATTTQYDALGRVVSISYSDGTPTRTYSYDVSSEWGDSLQNAKGRLVEAWSAANAGTIFSYDPMGRVIWEAECTPSICGSGQHDISYAYDWLGDLTSAGDGSGVTTTYGYNPASQIDQITSSLSDATHPGTLVSNVQDGPFGPVDFDYGNGLSRYNSYDALGRLNGSWLCVGPQTSGCSGLSQIYGFAINSQEGNEILNLSDNVLGQRLAFTYDSLGQLSTMSNSSGQELYNWTYDRWGNRWDQTVDSGSGPSPQLSFNTATNQVSGYGYDAAGDMTSDGLHTYTYDANGNVIAVDGGNTATYVYNALNQRVEVKELGSDSEEFVYNLNGQRVSIWDGNTGSQIQGQVYWGTQPLEFYENGAAHFQFQDWEGTERVQTSYNGAVEGMYSSLPFGDDYSASGTDDDAYHFAMLDQDTNDNGHAMFREYSSMSGRWMSPDPYMGSYDIYNPQSFNRYAYVLDNPLGYVDPWGLGSQKVNTSAGGSCTDGYETINGKLYACGGPPVIVIQNSYANGGDPWDTTYGIMNPPSNYYLQNSSPGAAPNKGSWFHRQVCSAFAGLLGLASSQNLNSTVGLGVGGNGGVGFILGAAASAGLQFVADSSGNVGVSISVGGNPGYGVFGVGVMAGVQGSVSTAKTIYDLRGGSVDFGASFGSGPAVGLDGSAAMDGSSFTGTVTVGPGVGTKGSALGVDYTWVPSALSTNCH